MQFPPKIEQIETRMEKEIHHPRQFNNSLIIISGKKKEKIKGQIG